jgi:hypothetical protein
VISIDLGMTKSNCNQGLNTIFKVGGLEIFSYFGSLSFVKRWSPNENRGVRRQLGAGASYGPELWTWGEIPHCPTNICLMLNNCNIVTLMVDHHCWNSAKILSQSLKNWRSNLIDTPNKYRWAQLSALIFIYRETWEPGQPPTQRPCRIKIGTSGTVVPHRRGAPNQKCDCRIKNWTATEGAKTAKGLPEKKIRIVGTSTWLVEFSRAHRVYVSGPHHLNPALLNGCEMCLSYTGDRKHE